MKDTATQRNLRVAKLGLLHAQVEPHFLYNTLGSAKYLIQSDPVKAGAMIDNDRLLAQFASAHRIHRLHVGRGSGTRTFVSGNPANPHGRTIDAAPGCARPLLSIPFPTMMPNAGGNAISTGWNQARRRQHLGDCPRGAGPVIRDGGGRWLGHAVRQHLHARHGNRFEEHSRTIVIGYGPAARSRLLPISSGVAATISVPVAGPKGEFKVNKPMLAIVAEDEELFRDALLKLLKDTWPDLTIAAICEGRRQRPGSLEAHQPDVAFLDIRMPGLTGSMWRPQRH